MKRSNIVRTTTLLIIIFAVCFSGCTGCGSINEADLVDPQGHDVSFVQTLGNKSNSTEAHTEDDTKGRGSFSDELVPEDNSYDTDPSDEKVNTTAAESITELENSAFLQDDNSDESGMGVEVESETTVHSSETASLKNERQTSENSAHTHVWVTEKKILKEPYDEKVLVQEAYDSKEVDQPAWDEAVIVSEGWAERFVIITSPVTGKQYRFAVPLEGPGTVVIPEPWDEGVYELHDFCYCGLDLTQYNREHGTNNIWAHSDEELGKCYIQDGVDQKTGKPYGHFDLKLYKQLTGQDFNHNGWYGPDYVQVDVIHHDTCEYSYFSVEDNKPYDYVNDDIIYHPPVVHDAVYKTVHHAASYKTIHHAAEYSNVTICSICGQEK